MKCIKAEDLLSAYIEKDLDSELTAQLEEHLSQCSSCSELLKIMSEVMTDLPELPDVIPPKGLNKKIINFTLRPAKSNFIADLKKAVFNPRIDVAAAIILGFFIVFFSPSLSSPRASELFHSVKAFTEKKVIESKDFYEERKDLAMSLSVADLPLYEQAKETYIKIESKLIKEK